VGLMFTYSRSKMIVHVEHMEYIERTWVVDISSSLQ
jgi:hypothetical protein